MSRRLTHWLVLGVVTTLVGLMGAQPAQAADKPKPVPGRASFGLQPATKGKIDSRPAYRYGVTPGGTLKDQVAIRNISLQALTFRVYATDALNNPDGGFGLMPAAQRPRDAGSWLSVGGAGFSGAVRVGARATVVLPLALTVPQNAQPGDHTGGVIVSLATRSTNKQGAAVILDQRVATRVYIRVSGPLKPQLTIKPVRASYAGSINPFGRGKTVARYTVTNTGNVNIGADQVVKVRGLLGPTSLARPKPANLDLLFPGSSVQVAVTVPRTWPLIRERLTVSLSPLVQVADPVAGLGTFTATTSFWAVPWAPLALIVILGLLGWLIRRMRRSRRPQAPAAGQATMLGERRARRLGALSSMAVAALVGLPGAAHAADTTPYHDANVRGGLTFCDAGGRAVVAGPLSEPFGVKVVSSSAAKPPYDAVERAAALLAFQPRQGVEPGLWSGLGLTALSRYKDVAHPAVEILPRDLTPGQFAAKLPPQWQGLLQLRVYLRAANVPQDSTSYAATDIRVEGTRWRQVGPGAGDVCPKGSATSVARALGLPTAATSPPPPTPAAVRSASKTPKATTSTTPASASSSSPPTAPPSSPSVVAVPPAPASQAPEAASMDVGRATGSSLGWIVPVGVLTAIGGGLAWWGRSRRG